jgi:sec-independent protein translocase protein TatA
MFGHAWVIPLIVLLIVLIIFGPGKLSQLGGAIGRSVNDFRKTQDREIPPSPSSDPGTEKKTP